MKNSMNSSAQQPMIVKYLESLHNGIQSQILSRYAIGYTGCVEIDGGYHDALLVSFFETTLESGFSAYVLYEGMGAGDGFMWSDPEPAGEETPLI